ASVFGGDRGQAKKALLSAMYGGAGGEAGQLLAVLRRRFPPASGYVEAAARAGEEGPGGRAVLGRTCPPPPAPGPAPAMAAGGPLGRAARRGPAAGSPATSWCRRAPPTGPWSCWPPCAAGSRRCPCAATAPTSPHPAAQPAAPVQAAPQTCRAAHRPGRAAG